MAMQTVDPHVRTPARASVRRRRLLRAYGPLAAVIILLLLVLLIVPSKVQKVDTHTPATHSAPSAYGN